MHEKENILRIFQETKKAVKEGNSSRIKELSNETTNTASLTHDPDNIAAAVVVYALSEIIEKRNQEKKEVWEKFYEKFLVKIDGIIDSLKKDNDSNYDKLIKSIYSEIESLSGESQKYIKEVFRRASIDKASRIYDHGISMEKTANLLGITLYELASYAGERERSVPNQSESKTVTVKSRIKLVEDIFK